MVVFMVGGLSRRREVDISSARVCVVFYCDADDDVEEEAFDFMSKKWILVQHIDWLLLSLFRLSRLLPAKCSATINNDPMRMPIIQHYLLDEFRRS